ncbi:MAG: 50S ribosomal protein L10 [Acholeplasmataceae bacterium]
MKLSAVERKQLLVDELAAKIQQAKTIIAFDDLGLTVKESTDLRVELHKENCSMAVYKNNITRRAMEQSGYGEINETMVGKKVLIFSNDDVVAPARIIYQYGRNNKKVAIQSGVIEGKVASLQQVVELATLPSYETLLTQLAAGLLMPLREVAIGLNMLTERE